MTDAHAHAHALADDERARFARDGYVVRAGVFGPDEVAAMTEASEALVTDLVRDRVGRRLRAGSYVFDPDLLRGVSVKWEGDSDVVHGIEPVAHLSPELDRWAHDERLVGPMRAIVDDPEPMLFTEKLNLKRPRHGGPNPLHQDYPYWRDVTDDPSRVATTIVYLDDSSWRTAARGSSPAATVRARGRPAPTSTCSARTRSTRRPTPTSTRSPSRWRPAPR
jgi:hypothetical protein